MREVLVVSAHPDDEVLGVGATIALLRARGARVTVVVVTDGSSSQYPGDAAVADRKNAEMAAAHAVLGTDELLHWDFPDMRLDTVVHVDLNRAFEDLLGKRRFDTVFVHHSGDLNLDHVLVHRSVLVATRPHPEQSVRTVLSYHVNSSTEWGFGGGAVPFVPNVFVDATETIDRKLAALRCYVTELRPWPHPRSIEAVDARAQVWGSEAGYERAEGFMLVRHRVARV
jgi:N-acetylglucosamine malate deacetylase 1